MGGGFTDWFITTYHRPALTIEISNLVGETNPPLSIFQKEWKRNRNVGIKIAKEAKKYQIKSVLAYCFFYLVSSFLFLLHTLW